jgi:hemolysin III
MFRALDQGFIYFLIAATYTPFSLAYLRTTEWWLLLGAVWGVALYGFVSKVFFAHRVEAVSIWPYVLLGWLPIISVPALIHLVDDAAFWWMLVGGLCYTVGTVFLVCDQKVRHFHAIWHLLVIAGSACHFLAILLFVASAG